MEEEEPRLLLPPQLPEEEEAVEEDGARHTLTRHTQCRTLDHTLTDRRTGTPRCTHTAAMAVAEVLLPLLPPQLLRAAAAVDLVDRSVSAVSRRRLSWLRRLPLRSLPDDRLSHHLRTQEERVLYAVPHTYM